MKTIVIKIEREVCLCLENIRSALGNTYTVRELSPESGELENLRKAFDIAAKEVTRLLSGQERKTPEMSLLKLYHKFYAAWNRCESNRGCYSCSPRHDCRCEKDRKISDKCTCGRDELEKAEVEIDELESCRGQGEG